MPDASFEMEHHVSFGDCDPAGILFYPHHFRFMDATFQGWLRARGTSQAAIRERFGAVGTGLIEAEGTFRGPVHDGDRLAHALTVAGWTARTLHVTYVARVGGRTVFEGRELRGLFRREGERLRLTALDDLRVLLEA